MSTNEQIAFLIGFNSGAIHRAIDDITDEEPLVRGADNSSHIRWLTGHLTESMHYLLTSLGGSYDLPKSFGDAFKTGREASQNADEYPSMDELRTTLFELRKALQDHVLKVPDDVWAEPAGEQSMFPNKAAMAMFFCQHDFYHLGQMVTIRRAIGRERPFG